MPHAAHFLERLERASTPEADLALTLYRDPPAVREVLARAKVPDTIQRVALSLAPGDNGPFAVVSTTGAFITCLGEGMVLRGLAVVPHRKVVGELRSHDERGRAVELGQGDRLASVLRGTFEASHRLTREQFEEVAPLRLLVAPHLLKHYVERFVKLCPLAERLEKLHRAHPRDHAPLRAVWVGVWTMVHQFVLATMGGARDVEVLLGSLEESRYPLAQPLFEFFELGLALRAVWCIGRLGKSLVVTYKRRLQEAGDLPTWLEATSCLMAIGLRYSKLHAEVTRAVTGEHRVLDVLERGTPGLGQALRRTICSVMDEPGLHQRRVLELLERPEHGGPPPAGAQDDPDLRWSWALARQRGSLMEGANMLRLLAFLPWLARCHAADLYLPQPLSRQAHRAWCPEDSLMVLDALRRGYEADQPVHVAPKVGRNDPCPCGSGKKYKHCCLS